MAELSYQWGRKPPQPQPHLVGEGELTLLVRGETVWTGDVSTQLRQHALAEVLS